MYNNHPRYSSSRLWWSDNKHSRFRCNTKGNKRKAGVRQRGAGVAGRDADLPPPRPKDTGLLPATTQLTPAVETQGCVNVSVVVLLSMKVEVKVVGEHSYWRG